MHENLRTYRLSGSAINAYLPELAKLRIEIFRDYPYLYEGSLAYEERYLQTYANVAESVMVLVLDQQHVVGASSGLPLAVATPDVIAPFVATGYDPARIFYYGESVLLAPYRGLGLGKRFFEEREAHARALGHIDSVCFCAVERPPHHPRRPADYRPLDAFWKAQGFSKHPTLHTTFSWRDRDEATESPKPMVFWLKPLN